jgi:D-aminopeptidase
MTTQRRRARALGLRIGRYEPGPYNAITDVAGVRVGHCTVIRGEGSLVRGQGPVRTGVTAILPNDGNVFMERVIGGAFVLNGAGEMSGLLQVLEWGLIETPILLTNSLSVGAASSATVRHLVERFPGIGDEHDVILPLVGECDDSFLNDIAGHHVGEAEVFAALRDARTGEIEEGNVGGGTGMVTCDLKGGIGTSSRKLPESEGAYTVGVLVMSNVGRLDDLRIDGEPVAAAVRSLQGEYDVRKSIYGSIIVVVATDAPVNTHQINRLCRRAALGIGRIGSYAAHGSGEIVVGFSTANKVPREPGAREFQLRALADRALDPLYQAVIEATEEAILNAMCCAEAMVGANDRHVPALPLEVVSAVAARRGAARR